MVDKVITLGRTVVPLAVIRGTSSAPIGGDFREIRFTCRFTADAVNAGAGPAPEPQIRVRVTTLAAPHTFQVEIIPPGGNREVLRSMRRQNAPTSWTRRVVVDDEGTRVAARPPARLHAGAAGLRTAGRAAPAAPRLIGRHDWEFDDPFGDIDDVLPVDPPGGGGGGAPGGTFIRVLNPAVDESGTWTVRVRNNDQDDQTFTIVLDHPETVQTLGETRIPFQLINRTFAQALLAMRLRIKIDNGQARIEFDRAFRDLTGVEDQIIAVPGAIDDVNLEEFTVEILNEENTPTIRVGLDLEDRGDEIGLPGPDVDLENLAIQVRINSAVKLM